MRKWNQIYFQSVHTLVSKSYPLQCLLTLQINAINLKSFQQCSEAPSGICGKHASCIDSIYHPSYDFHNGAFCACSWNTFGKPPNCELYCDGDCPTHQYCNKKMNKCVVGCEWDHKCADDEYCSDNKCKKICATYEELPCGPNSKCTGIKHRKYCSCDKNYFPGGKNGCRIKQSIDVIPVDEDSLMDCSEYCGHGSSCKIIDGNINCYCKNPSDNPFAGCSPEIGAYPIKPTHDSEISLATVIVLATG